SDAPAAASERAARASDRRFLTWLYAAAALVRLVLGAGVYFSGNLYYFAGDAYTYDTLGWELAKGWAGNAQYTGWLRAQLKGTGHNGMIYWVAGNYALFGHSPWLLTCIQIVITSLIPVLVFRIALVLYGSRRVARYSALMAAFFPSMIIWSCLLLKDALVIFL